MPPKSDADLQKVHVRSRSRRRKLSHIAGTTPTFDQEARMLRSEFDLRTIPQIDRRPCPKCRSSMRLMWIEPDNKSGYDKRTFECTHCHFMEIVTVKYR